MEALFSINKAQFHQFVTHVSVYHEDCSPGFKTLATDSLARTGLKPDRFTYWNVPNMNSLLGKAVPVDIHNGYVLADEAKALSSSTGYGVLRYALLASAVRAKEGGRRRYDFITMNTALAVGCASGFGFLSYGRRRWGWMRRRPFGCVVASFGVCLAAVGVTRVAMRTFGVGLIMAEKGHKKALKCLDCVDCIDEVNAYTAKQITELREQQLPQQPGMPPPPEEFKQRFEKGKITQIKLLEIDMEEVRVLRKAMTSHWCDRHRGLRAAPETYSDPTGLLVDPSERVEAKKRIADAAPALPAS